METLVMQGLNYRGDARLQDGATYSDCTFDQCRISGNNLTFRNCTMSVGTRFQNCEGTLTFDGTEFVGEVTDEVSAARFDWDNGEDFRVSAAGEYETLPPPPEIRWIGDMEAILMEPDGTVVHATFHDPEQVAAFKAGLAKQE